MKKVKRVAARKQSHARPASRRTPKDSVVYYRRIFILGSLVVLLAVIVIPNQNSLRQDVRGVSIQYGQFDKAVVPLPQIPGTVSYNIYYKAQSESQFTNAAREIPTSYSTYTINYLKLNTVYKYRISAKDITGKEIYWTPEQTITNEQPM